MKKKLIILSTIGVILIGIIAGASYAYFTVGNSTGNEDVITSGTMSLLLTDGSEVTANNLIPGEYVEKTFKVKNTGNVDTRYDVYFSEVINTFVDKTDLVYTLTSLDGGYNTTSEVVVPSTETKIVNQQLITPNEEHTYTLRITFKLKQTIQNENMGRTFTAKININEYNLNNGEHFLKLIDAGGNEVDKQILAANKTNYTLSLSNTNLTNSTNIYCNNGGIPTINGNTLNVSDIASDTECRISNDIVDTINNKLLTTKTGVVMTNDQNMDTTMTVPSSKEVVFDLNGKTILHTPSSDINLLINNGVFTINDESGNGTFKSTYRLFSNKYEMTINNGKYIRENPNTGAGGIIHNDNGGNTIINDGYYSTDRTWGLFNSGNNNSNRINKFTINGGSFNFSGNGLYNATWTPTSSVIEVNDGIFVSKGNPVDNTIGTININGGSFTSTGGITVMNESTGTININDGYFISNTNDDVFNNSSGTININGGTFTLPNTNRGVTVRNEGSGTLNITDSNNKVYISNIYDVDPTNTSSSKAILNRGSGTININGNIADTCNENLNSNNSGICVYSTQRAILNEDVSTGIVNVNGVYAVSENNCAICHYSRSTNVKNTYAKSNKSCAISICTNANVSNPSESKFKICNTTLSSANMDIYVYNEYVGEAKYSNITFTNGTTNPGANGIYNPNNILIETTDACTWSSN